MITQHLVIDKLNPLSNLCPYTSQKMHHFILILNFTESGKTIQARNGSSRRYN